MIIALDHTIEALGIKLTRLQHSDIEEVRQWRNNPAVSQYMAFRDEITPAMQEAWFTKLDPSCQFFFIIEHKQKRIGLVNLKDSTGTSAEGGIFIADETMQNSSAPMQAILAMYDFGFGELGLQQITAHILSDNPRAIRFNQALGFRKSPGQESVANQHWTLSPEDYSRKTQSLRTYLQASQ